MHKSKEIIVTTTSVLDGYVIDHYLQPVSTHLVAGTNILKDFMASFTDFFGGRSKTYQSEISSLYEDAVDELRNKALSIGGNCIIGLSVDMDQISGKGMSMFMITATGTVAIARRNTPVDEDSSGKISYKEQIPFNEIESIRKRREILECIDDETFDLTDKTWGELIEFQIGEAFPVILKKWKQVAQSEFSHLSSFIEKLLAFFEGLPTEKRIELVYSTMAENEIPMDKGISQLISEFHLVDFNVLKDKIEHTSDLNIKKRLLLPLLYDKEYYNEIDIHAMEELKKTIKESYRESGPIIMKKQLFSSKEKPIWRCRCGAEVIIGERCPGCGKDIYGFTKDEVNPEEALTLLDEKIDILRDVLNIESVNESEADSVHDEVLQ